MRLRLAKEGNTQRNIHYDPNSEIPNWELGMIFKSVDEFKEVVSKYVMARGLKLTIKPNEPKRVNVTPRPRGEGVSLCWDPYHKHISL